AALGWALGIAVKLAADRSAGHPPWLALLQPLSAALLVAIAAASWHGARRGGYRWKGRRYS
ncbi:hypothetical protein IDH44_22010, partial [Paenibacillus sp. IB182496]|nr:hypothetical protein [Paenibacillus sabuli]